MEFFLFHMGLAMGPVNTHFSCTHYGTFDKLWWLDAKYNKTDVNDVVKQQSHLTATQKKDLLELLTKHSKLFSDKLGRYRHKKFHINIDPEATPVHARAYPVPRIHLKTFHNELNHLVELGVLQPQGVSEHNMGGNLNRYRCRMLSLGYISG